MVSQCSDRLAVNDDALLEQLQLWKMIILPGEPKPEVVMDIRGFVNATLNKTKQNRIRPEKLVYADF